MRVMGLVLAAMLSGCAFRAGGMGNANAPEQSPPTISVTGRGEVWSKPDLVVMHVGAEIKAEQASIAQRRVSEIVNKTLAALRKAGIEDRNVQTSGLSVKPIYSNDDDKDRRLIGYIATNLVEIRYSDPAKSGEVIDAAMGAGTNRLESIVFQLTNDHDQGAAAMEKAAKDAKEKAMVLAGAMGVKLLGIESINGGIGNESQSLFGGSGGGGGDQSTPVEQGQVRVTASVNVSYRIAQAD